MDFKKEITQTLIDKLRDEWIPQVSTTDVVYYHTNHQDNRVYELYFDVYRNEWTDKETAFRGYVFNYISSMLRSSI